jgi:hypothetical protein
MSEKIEKSSEIACQKFDANYDWLSKFLFEIRFTNKLQVASQKTRFHQKKPGFTKKQRRKISPQEFGPKTPPTGISVLRCIIYILHIVYSMSAHKLIFYNRL